MIPKPVRDALGLGPVGVELSADGAALRIEPVSDEAIVEEAGRLGVRRRGQPSTMTSCGPSATPTSADDLASKPQVLVDPSVAIPLTVADHEGHRTVATAVAGKRLGLAGHAAFETFSVLTRLPPPARRRPSAVHRLLAHNFPASRFMNETAASELLAKLASLGVAGGTVYDALVGATAAQHGLVLFTRDRRAVVTYRALDVRFEFVE